jgi:prophage tail gpP-like protein
MSDDVVLLVGGIAYGGWTEIGITRAMDAASGAFNLSLTDKWYGQETPWQIIPGDTCEVQIGGETVISGYVDIVRPSFDSGSHTIEVQGRDKSADVIDCSAVHSPDEWSGVSLLTLAQTLCAPFGVTVTADVSIGDVFGVVKIQQGETAFEAIDRHARMRQVLVMPDGKGGIVLTRAGTRRASVDLVHPGNILSAGGTLDSSERFSDYIVRGQSGYAETSDPEAEAFVEGSTQDTGVTRYRPLLMIAETDPNGATAQDRAAWEANTRLGRSMAAVVTVQGWRQKPGGELWSPNLLANISSPWLQIGGEMLIRQVTYRFGSNGRTCDIAVVSPQSYQPGLPKRTKSRPGERNIWEESTGDESIYE